MKITFSIIILFSRYIDLLKKLWARNESENFY